MSNISKDVIIIGAGPVGIFAAFQAGLLGMKSVVIDALPHIGGQCSALYPEKPIYDIPSHPEISAQDLVQNLATQAAVFAPEYLLAQKVVSMQKNPEGFVVKTSKGKELSSKVVILAAGAGCFGPNRPPLAGIEQYEDNSVFYSVQSKNKFAGKKILIAGGGDSAVDWANSLSEIADVTILHRRKKFRAAPASIEKMHNLAAENKLKIITGFQLHGLQGQGRNLESVTVADLDNNLQSIEADILLPFFGLSQDLSLLEQCGMTITNHHVNVSTPYFETNLKGVYAVGDVASYTGKLKLILTGFAEVSSALHHAYDIVFDGKPLHFEYSTSKGVGK